MRTLHWFRNDLRIRDNTALAAAARGADELLLVFVLDDRLLKDKLVGPPRRRFLLGCLDRLAADLESRGQRLVLRHGDPGVEIPRLLRETRAERLTYNRDVTPYARRRDARVNAAAARAGVEVVACKDRVVFESHEIRTQKGDPFRVYTPFRRAWLERFRKDPAPPASPFRLPPPVRGVRADSSLTAKVLDARTDRTEIPTPGEAAARRRLDRFVGSAIHSYHRERDLLAVDGTSRLSPYLRLGAISVRTCLDAARKISLKERRAAPGVRTWIDEIIWREFYQSILADFPHVLRRPFKPEYDAMSWNEDPDGFGAWCDGRTGYPVVDAAMRQLTTTGWMHNRARMIVASFLTKDLLIDWRLGEAFFMQRLVDGDPASNNGGWQWAASTGTDAQPYFRIFNPVSQGQRFDPEGHYVRRFVPELGGLPSRIIHRPWEAPSPPSNYPRPILDHAERRRLALSRYKRAQRSKLPPRPG